MSEITGRSHEWLRIVIYTIDFPIPPVTLLINLWSLSHKNQFSHKQANSYGTWTGLGHEIEFKYFSNGFWISKCSTDEMSSLPFPSRFRWIHMEEITLLGDTSTEFLCSPRRFLFVHWLNSWFILARSSSSNMFSKLLYDYSKKTLKDQKRFLVRPRTIDFSQTKFNSISWPSFFL